MRLLTLFAITILCGCERPADRWELRTSDQVILRLDTVDPGADGLIFDDEPRFDRPNADVTAEWWQERRTVVRNNREEWVRVQVRDVPMEGLTCADAAMVTLWWDNVEWNYSVRIDPNDYAGDPIEPAMVNTGSQINDLSFIGGAFTVEHPCVAEGRPIAQTIFTQWSPGDVQRGLESPPPDQRR